MQKLLPLTSLRFFAALAIFFHHSRGYFLDVPKSLPLSQGVSFFFVLSGFILFYVYRDSLRSLGDFWKFFSARVARIYPAHILSLLFFLFARYIFDIKPGNGSELLSSKLLVNVLLLQSLVPYKDYFFGYNGVSWSISTEMFLYVFFFFLAFRFKKDWWLKIALTGGLVLVIASICENTSLNEFVLYINPLARVFEFTLGMLFCVLYLKIVHADYSLSSTTATVIEFSVLGCLLVLATHWEFLVSYADVLVGSTLSSYLKNAGLSWLYGIVILLFAMGQGLISSLLSHRVLVFLGELSFAFYLYHQTILDVAKKYFYINAYFPSPLVYLFLVFVLVLCVSYVSYSLFEVNARIYLRRLFQKSGRDISWKLPRRRVLGGVFTIMLCVSIPLVALGKYPPSTIQPVEDVARPGLFFVKTDFHTMNLVEIQQKRDGNYSFNFEIGSGVDQIVIGKLYIELLNAKRQKVVSRWVPLDVGSGKVAAGTVWPMTITFSQSQLNSAMYIRAGITGVGPDKPQFQTCQIGRLPITSNIGG